MTTNSPNKVKPAKLPKTSPSPKPPKAPKPKKVISDTARITDVGDGNLRLEAGNKPFILPASLFSVCKVVTFVFEDESGISVGKGLKAPGAQAAKPAPKKKPQKQAKKPAKK